MTAMKILTHAVYLFSNLFKLYLHTFIINLVNNKRGNLIKSKNK